MGEPLDSKDPVPNNEVILFSAPIFKEPVKEESKKDVFIVPVGSEQWVTALSEVSMDRDFLAEKFLMEYTSILYTMKRMDIPFRIIISHKEWMDEQLVIRIMKSMEIRGVALDDDIGGVFFPRDMFVNFDDDVYISSESNLSIPDLSCKRSPLGEGGRVLRVGKKVLTTDPRWFCESRESYINDIKNLSDRFDFAYLPAPLTAEIDIQSGTEKYFQTDHLDRVSAFIRGKDRRDYLLLDENYVSTNKPPYGKYLEVIKEACDKIDVIPIIVQREHQSLPCALNFEQFANGSVIVTSGDEILLDLLNEIVGEDQVYTTQIPMLYYPLIRQGSIRCMMLHAPIKIINAKKNS